ncbi:MAG TPA: thiamine pyrophosphate-dependent enzyme [Candidatus Bathyarchaeia archaeon]|jgi:sulfopyruvate decarboxylase subunit beta|nr:thiamine pyrophosphate-dependent enzyme [Candidatus Bathyarchaeia archaeon]
MKRIDCLKALAEITKDDDLVVTNLGNTPHEWLSVRPSRANLYGMNLGQCTPVALGLALALPHRRVFALDGDGNLLLNLASLADTSHRKPSNLRIIVFDNEAYESPGGMPTATAHGVDLVQVAKGCGIKKSFVVSTVDDFRDRIKLFEEKELCLIVAKIETGTIERPPYSSLDYKFNKYLFATYIEETEKKPVLRLRSKSPFTN